MKQHDRLRHVNIYIHPNAECVDELAMRDAKRWAEVALQGLGRPTKGRDLYVEQSQNAERLPGVLWQMWKRRAGKTRRNERLKT